MHFQILRIVLWPSKPEFKARIVPLDAGCVNVISGASRTGKSAIVPIIDYCLGADRCAIPVETIRNACSWFGVVIQTDEGQKLFARRGPGNQRTTGEMCTIEGVTVQIPPTVQALKEQATKTTADNVKNRLDELAGLSRLSFDIDGSGAGFKKRPSFRDLMAFTFQPQNIVANPDVLFFKADTFEHREKLKTIFPYVLGAVSPQVMAAQHECEAIRREITKSERELSNLRQISARWNAELRSWVVQARELGLIDHAIPPNAERDVLAGLLREAINSPRRLPSAEGINEAIDELSQLQAEEREEDRELRSLHHRFAEMSKLKQSLEQFGESLGVQRDRLALAKWLRKLEDPTQVCPVCSSAISHPSSSLDELHHSLAQVEEELSRSRAVPASFDRELLRVRQDIKLHSERLQAIGIRKREVEGRSEEARSIGFQESEIARFIGRAEQGLEMQDALTDDGALAQEIAELKEREQELSSMISAGSIEDRKRRALDRVTTHAARLLPNLDTEYPNDAIELSITELSLKVKRVDRDDFLWEIGSGANWLSYHVAVSLALQQFFVESKSSPVPSFLVYDQPSQVYFPRKLARLSEEDPQLGDEDIEAVRKIFKTLSQVTVDLKHRLQILVLDHAGTNVWGNIPGVKLVEEWRDGNKLIPLEWLTPES